MTIWNEEKLIAEGYTIRNALIKSADLDTSEYCSCLLKLVLEGDGWGVCYGGYCLGHAGTYIKREEIDGSKKGFDAILNIMWVLESNSLMALKGKYCRVATKDHISSTVRIIGHIIEDRWFDYGSFFKEENDET